MPPGGTCKRRHVTQNTYSMASKIVAHGHTWESVELQLDDSSRVKYNLFLRTYQYC